MKKNDVSWRKYQVAVAEFFREQGCSALVEESVAGLRARHDIDVYVSFKRHGVACKWIIECKLWNRKVTKEKILALRAIVDDVGADRGIVFSESGFQPGAVSAARQSNILLVSSLEAFKATALTRTEDIPLVLTKNEEASAAPVFQFPGNDEPQSLLLSKDRLFVGNWQTGNIAIVRIETKEIERFIQLDKYEVRLQANEPKKIFQYSPGQMTIADGKLFVGQVFSDFLLVIDIETCSIVRRISIPGGGEGAITSASDGSAVYFFSNKVSRFFIIDSESYAVTSIDYPKGGRGCLCAYAHPTKRMLYAGIQRGGQLNGQSFPGGNCFFATYDLDKTEYVANVYLAEVVNGKSDDAVPYCITFDQETRSLFVGMFQSKKGIYEISEDGTSIIRNIDFRSSANAAEVESVDPLCQVIYQDQLLSINRNNYELICLDKNSGQIRKRIYLGRADNGPSAMVVCGSDAIVGYPRKQGLIFVDLS